MKIEDSTSSTPQPLLSVRGVVKKFGSHTAVNGLDFEIEAGEIVSLLGPNGAGKTTTIEMCEGFQRPDEGEISLFGMDPFIHSDEVRSRIGVMLQGGGAYPGIRVGEMLDLVASYSANPLDTEWLLELVGLQDRKKSTYRRLSGGQQQRMALACALVIRPELVFFDEPTAGLDAQARMDVWDLIRSLRRDGVAVILTTHLLDEAEALSDRVIIIDNGKIVASGTPDQLTKARDNDGAGANYHLTFADDISADAFHKSLLHNAKDLNSAGTLKLHVVQAQRRQLSINGLPDTPGGVLTIAAAAADCGALIRKLDSSQQSLEEVFLTLTGRGMRS